MPIPSQFEWSGHRWFCIGVGVAVGIVSFAWVGPDRLRLAILVSWLYGMTAGVGLWQITRLLRFR